MNAVIVVNETSNVIGKLSIIGKNIIDKISKFGKNIILDKRVQGATIAIIIVTIGLYCYDPLMNYLNPPAPFYMFWK